MFNKITGSSGTVSGLDFGHFFRNIVVDEIWENSRGQRDAPSGRVAGIFAKNIYPEDGIPLRPSDAEIQRGFYDWNPWSMRRVEIIASQADLPIAGFPQITGGAPKRERKNSDDYSSGGRDDIVISVNKPHDARRKSNKPDMEGGTIFLIILLAFGLAAALVKDAQRTRRSEPTDYFDQTKITDPYQDNGPRK